MDISNLGIGALQGLVTAGVVAVMVRAVLSVNSSEQRHIRAAFHRVIRPRKGVFLGIAAGAFAIAAPALFSAWYYAGIYTPGNQLAALAVGTAFLLGGVLMLANLHPDYDVCWDHRGLSGPTSYWPPPFGPGRMTLEFDQIAYVDLDWAQSYCVYDRHGRSIRFSYYYNGFTALMEAIEQARPDLFPEDMPINE